MGPKLSKERTRLYPDVQLYSADESLKDIQKVALFKDF